MLLLGYVEHRNNDWTGGWHKHRGATTDNIIGTKGEHRYYTQNKTGIQWNKDTYNNQRHFTLNLRTNWTKTTLMMDRVSCSLFSAGISFSPMWWIISLINLMTLNAKVKIMTIQGHLKVMKKQDHTLFYPNRRDLIILGIWHRENNNINSCFCWLSTINWTAILKNWKQLTKSPSYKSFNQRVLIMEQIMFECILFV